MQRSPDTGERASPSERRHDALHTPDISAGLPRKKRKMFAEVEDLLRSDEQTGSVRRPPVVPPGEPHGSKHSEATPAWDRRFRRVHAVTREPYSATEQRDTAGSRLESTGAQPPSDATPEAVAEVSARSAASENPVWDRRFRPTAALKGVGSTARHGVVGPSAEHRAASHHDKVTRCLPKTEGCGDRRHAGRANPEEEVDEWDYIPSQVRLRKADEESSQPRRTLSAPPDAKRAKTSAAAGASEIRRPAKDLGPPLALLGASGLTMSVPGAINSHLRPYQREGVQFLFRQYAAGQGGILADDMGLGKTVQTIAFVTAVVIWQQEQCATGKAQRVEPVLIVVPPAVITNWLREFDQWASGLYRVTTIHGATKESGIESVVAGEAQVAVTSYSTWLQMVGDNNSNALDNDLTAIPWHMSVYDEAHLLKNKDTKTYVAAAKIQTKLRYGLSGTVMSNSYDELWTMLDFVVPGSLGRCNDFKEYYARKIKLGQRSNATPSDLSEGRERQRQLTELVHKYLLRRTKDATIRDQLPTKTDNIVICQLSELQLRAYRRLLASPDFQAVIRYDEACPCGSSLTRGKCCHNTVPEECGGVLWPQLHNCTCSNAFDPLSNPKGCKRHRPDGCTSCPLCILFPCLTLLQKVSNHLELIKADPRRPGMTPEQLQRDQQVANLVLGPDAPEVNGICTDLGFMSSSNAEFCGKLTVLNTLLERWDAEGGNKVLLFSYSTKTLDIIQNVIIRHGYNFIRMDGGTVQKDRQALVDRFNHSASCFIFLVSTKAGGLGLNLTGANKVVVFDPSWNPAYDLQAQDRAFRLGQRRDVTVYRLVACGTLEELVYNRQLYKQQQSNSIVMGHVEHRYFEGVQPESSHRERYRELQGELWGVRNLLKMTADVVQTKQITQTQQVMQARYKVARFETDGNMEDTPEMLQLVALFNNSDEMDMAELAMRVNDIASQTRCPNGVIDHEAALLRQSTGVVHMFEHRHLLGDKKAVKACAPKKSNLENVLEVSSNELPRTYLQSQCDGRSPTLAVAMDGCRGVELENAAIHAMALWQGCNGVEMARKLLGMTRNERDLYRHRCAAVLFDDLTVVS